MTAITDQPVARPALGRAAGIELLGDLKGSGYADGAALVRRDDGQVVQIGALMYALLEAADGRRDAAEVASVMSERLGRSVDEEHVARLAEKLAEQGLLAGTEHRAPPRRNPLLALRWKVLVTNPRITRALTAPFRFLFWPVIVWPVAACFVAVMWFVLVHKGIGSATSQAFHRPSLLLLVFALGVLSAGFHELGHASACRYGGATPGGMGVGIYMVWPAFYTDVTDAYRLPRRDRLRVDLGGIYFNALIAVVTMGVWLFAWRADALLLLVALQLLIMVKNLSPVIRSDGYHILADATGIPDLYAHIGPTLRRLLPWRRREPSALTGRARLLVTVWVLVVVPVLLSLMLGAVLLLPRLLTSAWDSGRTIASAMPHESATGTLASLLRLVALFLPVLGSALVTQRLARMGWAKGRAWSAGRPVRRAAVVVCAAGAVCGTGWAMWPAGQYQPVPANASGTLGSFVSLVSSPRSVARPVAQPARVRLTPGTHLAVAMIPVGGATKRRPALFVIEGQHGSPAVAVLSTSAPDPARTGGASTTPPPSSTVTTATTTTAAPSSGSSSQPVQAVAFPFQIPSAPGPGGTQAVAVGRKSHGVVYDVAYSLVTVSKGAPVTNTNAAYALANCKACTTVAVSFQVVLVVGRSALITPINAAVALNSSCPACLTTAVADQIVVTLKSQPTKDLVAKLDSALQQLNALPALGANGTPAAIAAQVSAVQQQIVTTLNASGQLANPIQTTTTATTPATTTTSATTTTPRPATTTTATTSSTTTAATTTATTTSSATTTTEPATTTTGTTTNGTTTDQTTTSG